MFRKFDRIYDEYDFLKMILDGSIVAKEINKNLVYHKYIYNRESMMYTIYWINEEGEWTYEYEEMSISWVIGEISNDFNLFDGWIYVEVND